MLRFGSVLSALLLNACQPASFGLAAGATAAFIVQAPIQAQSAEAVAKVAQAITVRIEGATQGSGVLVRREGNTYTVLTAWHVVAGHVRGEELDIETPDGKRYRLNEGSIQKIGEVDLSSLTFNSSSLYDLAQIGDIKSVSMGSTIYVAGFPLSSTAIPVRMLRFLKGDVIANASVKIPNGYQLLYSNPTLPGMSGGVALNSQGRLVGIHGQAETDYKMSEQQGIAIKTGTNQAVPISFYSQYDSGQSIVFPSNIPVTLDDYLAQAQSLLDVKGSEQEVIRITSQALAIEKNADAYFYRSYAKDDLGDKLGSLADLDQAIVIAPGNAVLYYNRGISRLELGNNQGALADFDKAIQINPLFEIAYYNRAYIKDKKGENLGAIEDYGIAIQINPAFDDAYVNRGVAKAEIGDYQGSIADHSKALQINPTNDLAYFQRGVSKMHLKDYKGAIADESNAIAIDPKRELAYLIRGKSKIAENDFYGAIADYNEIIAINAANSWAYEERGLAKALLKDYKGACTDFQASVLQGRELQSQSLRYLNWCRSMLIVQPLNR